MASSSRLANLIPIDVIFPRSDSGSSSASSGCSVSAVRPWTPSYLLSIKVTAPSLSGTTVLQSAKKFCSPRFLQTPQIISRLPPREWTPVMLEVVCTTGKENFPRYSSSRFRRRGTSFITTAALRDLSLVAVAGNSPSRSTVLETIESPDADAKLVESTALKGTGKAGPVSSWCYGCPCGRRQLMASLGGLTALPRNRQEVSASVLESPDYDGIRRLVHPARPTWYEELYALTMAKTMDSYEAEIAGYKRRLFSSLSQGVEHILEIGIGTGPNLKYYGAFPNLRSIVGVDPNLQMAKYCKEEATVAGLSNVRLDFLHAVGEGIPVRDESMDVVVCTLTLCSVTDVARTLQVAIGIDLRSIADDVFVVCPEISTAEVKRVLKTHGVFVFVEHVAAMDGSALRFWQGVLDPLQQWVADGCHLTRDTLQQIKAAQFGSIQSERFTVKAVSIIGPHIMGVAYK